MSYRAKDIFSYEVLAILLHVVLTKHLCLYQVQTTCLYLIKTVFCLHYIWTIRLHMIYTKSNFILNIGSALCFSKKLVIVVIISQSEKSDIQIKHAILNSSKEAPMQLTYILVHPPQDSLYPVVSRSSHVACLSTWYIL